MNHFVLVASVLLLLTLWGPSSARAQASSPTSEQVLARIDSVLDAPEDMEARETMTLIEADGDRSRREVRIYQKGPDMRLVQFLSPADVRGVGFLRRAEDQLYLYLPAFRRVRRIGSSATREGFAGTDFSYEDLSQKTYGPDYRAERLKRENDRYVLELIPREDSEISYDRLIVQADVEHFVLRRIEYYRSGSHVKTMTVDRVERQDGYWLGRRMEMRDVRSGHRTVLKLSEVVYDQGLSDDLFTDRYLRRPVR